MSHLLASVNQEAADQIQPEAPRPRLPGIGQSVVYHMRRGHGRSGRTRFPALVQGHGERDTLMLTVVIDASDMVDEQHVSMIGPGKDDGHCWEWPEGVRPLAERIEEPAGLRGLVNSLDEQVGEIRACVLGDFDIPKISIIAIMQDFENRLRTVAAALRVDEAPAAPRAPRAKVGKTKQKAKARGKGK